MPRIDLETPIALQEEQTEELGDPITIQTEMEVITIRMIMDLLIETTLTMLLDRVIAITDQDITTKISQIFYKSIYILE